MFLLPLKMKPISFRMHSRRCYHFQLTISVVILWILFAFEHMRLHMAVAGAGGPKGGGAPKGGGGSAPRPASAGALPKGGGSGSSKFVAGGLAGGAAGLRPPTNSRGGLFSAIDEVIQSVNKFMDFHNHIKPVFSGGTGGAKPPPSNGGGGGGGGGGQCGTNQCVALAKFGDLMNQLSKLIDAVGSETCGSVNPTTDANTPPEDETLGVFIDTVETKALGNLYNCSQARCDKTFCSILDGTLHLFNAYRFAQGYAQILPFLCRSTALSCVGYYCKNLTLALQPYISATNPTNVIELPLEMIYQSCQQIFSAGTNDHCKALCNQINDILKTVNGKLINKATLEQALSQFKNIKCTAQCYSDGFCAEFNNAQDMASLLVALPESVLNLATTPKPQPTPPPPPPPVSNCPPICTQQEAIERLRGVGLFGRR